MDFEEIAANMKPERMREFMALSGKWENLRFFSRLMSDETQALKFAVLMGNSEEASRAQAAFDVLHARFQRELQS